MGKSGSPVIPAHRLRGCQEKCVVLATSQEIHPRIGLTLIGFKGQGEAIGVRTDSNVQLRLV